MVKIAGNCPILIPVGLLRTLGAVVNLEKLHITHAGKERQQSSTLVLPSSGHPLRNGAQDMEKLERSVSGIGTLCSHARNKALLRQFCDPRR